MDEILRIKGKDDHRRVFFIVCDITKLIIKQKILSILISSGKFPSAILAMDKIDV